MHLEDNFDQIKTKYIFLLLFTFSFIIRIITVLYFGFGTNQLLKDNGDIALNLFHGNVECQNSICNLPRCHIQ